MAPLPRPHSLAAALAALVLVQGAAAADAPATPNWAVSDDGGHVIELRARLAWPRCVEGMAWDGKRCTGQPRRMTHGQAVAWAAARSKAEGMHWRLPRVAELRRLAHMGGKTPGLDPKLFPAAPRDWHWSATANLQQDSFNPYNYGNIMKGRSAESAGNEAVLLGWAVDLGSGEAKGDVPKATPLPVRLVQSLD